MCLVAGNIKLISWLFFLSIKNCWCPFGSMYWVELIHIGWFNQEAGTNGLTQPSTYCISKEAETLVKDLEDWELTRFRNWFWKQQLAICSLSSLFVNKTVDASGCLDHIREREVGRREWGAAHVVEKTQGWVSEKEKPAVQHEERRRPSWLR